MLLIGATAYGLIIDPIMERWQALNKQIGSKISILNKNVRLLGMYRALEEEYSKFRGFIKEGKNEEEELARALAEIENISQQSKSRIVNVKPRASRPMGNYKEISFEVTVEGDIQELARFLYEIEASPERLRIRNYLITPKIGSPNQLKASLLITKILLA